MQQQQQQQMGADDVLSFDLSKMLANANAFDLMLQEPSPTTNANAAATLLPGAANSFSSAASAAPASGYSYEQVRPAARQHALDSHTTHSTHARTHTHRCAC